MASRLIDADALKREINESGTDGTIANYVRGVLAATLDHAPTVDAEPVRHGRWVNYPECLRYEGAYHDEHIVCSACHSVWNIIDNDADRFDYCPNCGAKMDKEGDG